MSQFYNKKINKIYLINGLARSGNHLFITWLISAFDNNQVYYLNNIKINQYGIISNTQKIKLSQIIKYHIVCNNNIYGMKINENIRKKLVSTKNMINFLNGNINKINILIISLENKYVSHLDLLENIFSNYNKLYKIIVIRDILNLFSSRIESEKLLLKKNNKIKKSYFYLTDKETIKYWIEDYEKTKNNKYITFNYNKFICYDKSKKKLAHKLNIDINKTIITLNLFGMTKGSSFIDDINKQKNYFIRWLKNKNNYLIKYLLNNKKIYKILCKDFSICINSNKIKICDQIYNYNL